MADTFIIECRHGAVWYAQILTKPRLIDIESMRPGDVARIVTLDRVDVRLCTECEEATQEQRPRVRAVPKYLPATDALTEEE